MTYPFTPGPDQHELAHASWENAFTDDELTSLVRRGQAAQKARAVVGGDHKKVETIRRSDVAWLRQDEVPEVFDRFAFIARKINEQFFGFELYGFCEQLQFTTYRGGDGDGGFYDWHIDRGSSWMNATVPRKLSFVLMLSDPKDYEGGDLQIKAGPKPIIADPRRGVVHVFPSFVLHRVTPVTKGIRHTAVLWAGGPKFR